MAQGTVKWFNAEKGYGFIAQEDGGPDVFVHYSSIDGSGYRSLVDEQRVEFQIVQGRKGPKRKRSASWAADAAGRGPLAEAMKGGTDPPCSPRGKWSLEATKVGPGAWIGPVPHQG
ncbi:hypothetical protein SVIO_047110 [Streptomyces violaceusniger]|uniref:CSD domain-containing protein n=1 Tax=Streptomyces violaceusniger TaxID=68280 RepID=A0A4D4L6B6_STRVO|nr:hypothetical protein SVIO_047110 [Streptomyces violaceusniger]